MVAGVSEDQNLRRASDGGVLCWVALRIADFWDWIDNRDIDKHVVSVFIMYGTYYITNWAMACACPGAHRGSAYDDPYRHGDHLARARQFAR